jgi:nucleoside-diphosphate-sugar epimerase
MSGMKVLVIGGAGFIGRQVVRRLLEGGNDVTIFTRRNINLEPWMQVKAIIGDRSDRSGFRNSLMGRSFDAVIDLIAYNREDVEFFVKTPAKITGHYVLCSTGAVYRDYPGWDQCHPVEEEEADLTWKGDGSYCEGKREAELVLWSLRGEERPFPFTIFRLSVVEGPHDSSGRTWFWIQRIADGEIVLVPRTVPSTIFRHVYVDDVAEAIAKSVGNSSAFNQAYNLAGSEILTLEDYVHAIAEVMDRKAKIVSAPFELIREQAGLSGFEAPFMGERFVMSIGKAQRELGYRPTNLAKWLKPTVRWFLDEYHGPDSNGYDKRQFEVRVVMEPTTTALHNSQNFSLEPET